MKTGETSKEMLTGIKYSDCVTRKSQVACVRMVEIYPEFTHNCLIGSSFQTFANEEDTERVTIMIFRPIFFLEIKVLIRVFSYKHSESIERQNIIARKGL